MSNKFTELGDNVADAAYTLMMGYIILWAMRPIFRVAAVISIFQWIFNVQWCEFKWAARSWDNVGYFMGTWLMIEVFAGTVLWGLRTWGQNEKD